MPNMKLAAIKVAVCKVAQTNRKWSALRLEVIREKKVISLKEKTCRECLSVDNVKD